MLGLGVGIHTLVASHIVLVLDLDQILVWTVGGELSGPEGKTDDRQLVGRLLNDRRQTGLGRRLWLVAGEDLLDTLGRHGQI